MKFEDIIYSKALVNQKIMNSLHYIWERESAVYNWLVWSIS